MSSEQGKRSGPPPARFRSSVLSQNFRREEPKGPQFDSFGRRIPTIAEIERAIFSQPETPLLQHNQMDIDWKAMKEARERRQAAKKDTKLFKKKSPQDNL